MHRHTLIVCGALVAAGAAWGQGLPGMAAGILDQSTLARQAIAAHDQAGALDHVRQAAALSDSILKQSPQGAPVLVGVHQEVETTTTYTPVKRSKNDEMTDKRLKKHTSIRDADRSVTTDQLNVTTASERLVTAQAALDRNDFAAADTALSEVQGAVVRTQGNESAPLVKAHENLALARDRVTQGKAKDAVAPLRAAAQALAAYAKTASGPRAEQAERMRQQIEEYASNVSHHHDDALQRISEWLDPVDQWNSGPSLQ